MFKIDAGETMEAIKEREAAEAEAKRHVNYGEYTTDADTTLLLAALIQCEAGGESYEGQLAVGAVVMNRVRSAAYPDTIHGVIYASGQFTPAQSGKVNRVLESGRISQSCIDAATEAISGVSNVGDLTHFRRNNGREGLVTMYFIKSRKEGTDARRPFYRAGITTIILVIMQIKQLPRRKSCSKIGI